MSMFSCVLFVVCCEQGWTNGYKKGLTTCPIIRTHLSFGGV